MQGELNMEIHRMAIQLQLIPAFELFDRPEFLKLEESWVNFVERWANVLRPGGT